MKTLFLIMLLSLTLTMTAQEKKQYKSAETGRYVTKSEASKSPSTTYSTPRKSKSTSSGSTTVATPKQQKTTRSATGSSSKKKTSF